MLCLKSEKNLRLSCLGRRSLDLALLQTLVAKNLLTASPNRRLLTKRSRLMPPEGGNSSPANNAVSSIWSVRTAGVRVNRPANYKSFRLITDRDRSFPP